MLGQIESAIISAKTATDALEAIEGRLAGSTDQDDEARYATIWLVRDKLSTVLAQAEERPEALLRLHDEVLT